MDQKILKITDDQIRFIDKNGELRVEPNTPYYQVRILQFGDERIEHEFSKNVTVKETYDAMIFNAELNGEIAQIRPNYADMVCASIQENQENGSTAMFERIFEKNNCSTVDHDIIKSMFKAYDKRIKVTPTGFIIDDLFMVDRSGHAWVLSKNGDIMKCGAGAGQSLCLVVASSPNSSGYLDRATTTALAKIQFLLNPNTDDNVFMDQLPKEIRTILERRALE